MKSLRFFGFTGLCLLGALNSNAQVLQKLSLGIQGGINTPTNIVVQGRDLQDFQPNETADLSKGVFLQYELPDNFYLRSSFKKAAINLASTHQYLDGNTLLGESSSTVGFDNKQYELSLGYRRKIKTGFSFTGSLGATFLDFKRGEVGDLSFGISALDSVVGYSTSISTDLLKEKSVLVNAAIGLEYKTRRENAFLLELAYYKGFATVASYNFTINPFSQPAIENSLKTKGSYAEIRLGYRMPIQKFTNLYSAIKRPKIKPEPEAEQLKENWFKGHYLGLETAKQIFYSDQAQQWPDRSDKMQPSFWTSYLNFSYGYQFKSGFIAEVGVRAGAGGIQASGQDVFGMDSGYSFLMFTTPVSLKYAVPLMRNKLYLTPETGVWQSYSPWLEEGERTGPPNRSGAFTNIVTRIQLTGQNQFSGYHAGLSLNGRFGKSIELGFGYRYADKFSKKPMALIETTYDFNNVPQPSILTTTRLKNDAFTISFRKFLSK